MKRGIFKLYFKQYKFTILLFIMIFIAFWFILWLYNTSLEPVFYATILCFIAAALFMIVHFIKFVKRHRKLLHLMKQANSSPLLVQHNLPFPSNLMEEDYNKIISVILTDYQEQRAMQEAFRLDIMDYYSAWVHQIKTPIAAMRMKLQMEDTQVNHSLLTDLFHIEQYVEMVLCYVRLDSESSDIVLAHYYLDAIIKECIHKYAGEFVHKRLALKYEETRKQVLTDEKWLAFIIEQVLSNAIKYTNEGLIRIFFNADDILVIKDTGIGIAPEDLPRIFEKGYTGYNGRANKKSTGLGLYLSKKAAQKLSHRIWAESELGKGTTVYIDLHKSKLEVE